MKKNLEKQVKALKDVPGQLRHSSKKHAKQADKIEKVIKLAGKYME